MIKNQDEDLGLGDKVIQENRTRFLNKDGSFNVHRKGMFDRGAFSPYHAVLNASWTQFNFGLLGYYIFANIIFAFLYLACGRGAFPDIGALSFIHRFGQLFFYSVQVISTLGSSPMHPVTTQAEIVLAMESLIGLLGFALAASLLFARFSNPATKILFSENAVIAPYREGKGFMFRLINGRSNEIINLSAMVTMSLSNAEGKREIHQLVLERREVLVLPLNWTVVHPINESSPLYNLTQEDLKNKQAEFLVTINGVDQDLAKAIYARTSYKDGEVKVGYKFANMLEKTSEGTMVADPEKVGLIEKA